MLQAVSALLCLWYVMMRALVGFAKILVGSFVLVFRHSVSVDEWASSIRFAQRFREVLVPRVNQLFSVASWLHCYQVVSMRLQGQGLTDMQSSNLLPILAHMCALRLACCECD